MKNGNLSGEGGGGGGWGGGGGLLQKFSDGGVRTEP